MYYYMSLCNIPFLTYFKWKHGFVSKYVWMFRGWTPTKFVIIRVLLLMELLVMLCIFSNSDIFFSETADQKSFILMVN